MKIIDQFLQENTNYGNVDYSKANFDRLNKRKYLSNKHYWVYLGKTGGTNSNNLPYVEMPWHNYCWNYYHPNDRIAIDDRDLIHHKNENKLDNSKGNLIKLDKSEHDRLHLTKRRKEIPSKFNSKTASLGGKQAARNRR